MAQGARGKEYVLAPEEVLAFERDGYLVLREFLREEGIVPIEEVYQRFLHGQYENMGRDLCDMSGPYSRPFAEFNIVNAMLPRKYEPSLQGNLFERRAESVARQLVGEDATLDYDQFLSKRPRRDAAAFAWHQDLGYWPTGTPDTRTTTWNRICAGTAPSCAQTQACGMSHTRSPWTSDKTTDSCL